MKMKKVVKWVLFWAVLGPIAALIFLFENKLGDVALPISMLVGWYGGIIYSNLLQS